MTSRSFTLFLVLLALSFLPLETLANEPVDLAGAWAVKLDPDSRGEAKHWYKGFDGAEIELPGICTEAGLGTRLDLDLERNSKVYRHLYQRRSYIGAAWYQREFEVPENFKVRDAELILERVLWKSRAWINGIPIGAQSSLATDHRFRTGDALRVGKNRIVVCVDNREQVPIGTLGHGYTEQTQTIWNGIVGGMQIKPRLPISVEHLKVSPEVRDGSIRVSIEVNNRTAVATSIEVKFRIGSLGEAAPTELRSEFDFEVPVGIHTVDVELPATGLKLWSEFTPSLYEVSCELGEQQVDVTSGFRSLKAEQSRILVNGQRTFMRGTLDCCIFPKTGYPPTDVESWLKQFRTVKSYGLNHVRFHSWCPPEAAFSAADQLGLYLQVELPNWTNKMGHDDRLSRFLESEGNSLLRSYGHHPSFMFFSLGNELRGDLEFMDRLLLKLQSKAKHILMASTSYSFSKRGREPGPHDQFFVTQRTASGWVRGQRSLNQDRPETHSDFSDGAASVSLPLISHEIGQYSIYPNLDEIHKYDGNLRSLAFEAILANLKSKKRVADAKLSTENSGKLAVELYKEEIERAIRTPGQDGFQLLSLTDFSGQSTATVGILDAFWESKGLIGPEDFRKFCGPTVPLLRMKKRVFESSENFAAKVQVGHFGPNPLKNTDWHVVIRRQNETLFQTEYRGVDVELGNAIDIGELRCSLEKIRRPSRLTVSVSCSKPAVENHWSVWVYPDDEPPMGNVEIFTQANVEMFAALERGASVLLLPQRDAIRKPIDGRFVPVFWSPVHFPDQKPTHGTIIESKHPLFQNFPTDSHSDWQWWELLSESTSVEMSGIGIGTSLSIMRFIDKFDRNALPFILWEAKVGNGNLFVCSLDIERDLQKRPVAKALRNSILNYMNSEAFAPNAELDRLQLETLFKPVNP